MRQRLVQQIATRLGRASVELAPVVAGAANLAYEVRDASDPEAAPLAFLRCQGAGALAGTVYDLRREGRLLEAAAALGFPVADVLATFDEPVALLMGIVPGVSRPAESEIDAVAAEYLSLIARLHDTDPTHFPVDQVGTVREALELDLEFWARLAREAEVDSLPILATAERVLRETMPDGTDAPCLVHGDVGPGNFMIENGRVTALLDWELAHVGDRHEDLAWLWMRGAHTDFGDPLRRLTEYAKASGRALDRERIRWHLAFVMWKSCVSMEIGLRRFTATSATLLQTVVLLTYEALLGCQLVRVLGGALELLRSAPERESRPDTRLAERLLALPGLSREATLVTEYLRDASSQADWERRRFDQDLRDAIGIGESGFSSALARASHDELRPLANAVARAADRAAMAMPKAVRRIERGMRIGLGTACELDAPGEGESEGGLHDGSDT